jgi:hypothetical protein
MEMHSCNPNTGKAKAKGLQVPCQPELQDHSKTLSQEEEEEGRGGKTEGAIRGRGTRNI